MTDQITPIIPYTPADQNAPATADEMLAILGQSDYQQYKDTTEIRNPATGRIVAGSIDGADDQLNVRFTTEAVFNKLLTFRAGGVPKYSDMDFITISTPGDNKLVVHSPVTDYHQWRFPVEYANFKKGQSDILTGTPISLWPLMTPSQIREFENAGIRTIEQVANLSDAHATKFAGFYRLKTQAVQFLEQAKDTAAQGKLQAEFEAREAANKAEMNAMREQMDQMMKLLQAQTEKKKEK